jgi:glycine cleavage system pyridoxal-binding protein P
MQYKYFPHTDEDIKIMLDKTGLKSLNDLYADVPESIRFHGDYDLPEAMSEIEIRQLFSRLGKKNDVLTIFAGGGVYDHYSPAVIPSLIERSEFLTSYTPYQAEISQGTLHYIFEYQSMMAELTGMDISNASMYDGSTATAEAMLMAYNTGKKATKVLVSATVDPKVLRVVRTYAHYHGVDIEVIKEHDGCTDTDDMATKNCDGWRGRCHRSTTELLWHR